MAEIKEGRLSIEGPDKDGDFELSLYDSHSHDYTFLSRAQADALIVALGGTRIDPGGSGQTDETTKER